MKDRETANQNKHFSLFYLFEWVFVISLLYVLLFWVFLVALRNFLGLKKNL